MSQVFPIRPSLFALLIVMPIAAQAQQPNVPGETQLLCKEQCEKSCMGNDTPTERAKCLERPPRGLAPARSNRLSKNRWMSATGLGCVKTSSCREPIEGDSFGPRLR